MFRCTKLSRVVWTVVFIQPSLLLLALSTSGFADTFGSGEHTFEIEFVTVGEPGNPADTTGVPNPAGSVPYVYRIGKYEISEAMIDAANAITEAEGAPLGITRDTRGPNKPATSVSWFDWARFVNWLNTSTGNHPAYRFDDDGNFQLWETGDAGYNPQNLFRNRLAKYVIPSSDEWYKAAFYDPDNDVWWDFPNGSNTAPVPALSGTAPNTAVWNLGLGPADITTAGGASPFGTVAQAGNVWEWDETAYDLLNDTASEARGVRGFDSGTTLTDLAISSSHRSRELPRRVLVNVGLRVAAVPEPSTTVALVVVIVWHLTVYPGRCLRMRKECDHVAHICEATKPPR